MTRLNDWGGRVSINWQDTAEASDEYAAGKARRYDDVDALIADLDLTA